MRKIKKIIGPFKGEYAWLSNFYTHPFVHYGGHFRSAEHAYQCSKATTDGDFVIIRGAFTPAEAKRIAKRMPIRSDWEEIKLKVMKRIIWNKFNSTKVLQRKLIETKDAKLIEYNTWHDNFWGICTCKKCKEKEKGQNHLGRILMRVRRKLQAKYIAERMTG